VFLAEISNCNTGRLCGKTILKNILSPKHVANAASTAKLNLNHWHKHLAHVNHNDIACIHHKSSATGMSIVGAHHNEAICEPCLAGKLSRHGMPCRPACQETELLTMVHANLKGLLPHSTARHIYWGIFINDTSRFHYEYFLKSKDKLASTFTKYTGWAEMKTGCKLCVFHNNEGGEFVGAQLLAWMDNWGMQVKQTKRAELYQIGVVERAH